MASEASAFDAAMSANRGSLKSVAVDSECTVFGVLLAVVHWLP